MIMKLTKIAVALVASLLVFALAACSSPKESEADSTSGNTDIAALLATQPKNTEEATELHQKLMQKENEILSGDSKLWEKVFLAANKDMPMIEDGKNYGDFLLDTIEGTKDQFSAEELKKLKAGAQQVKEIEDKLTALEKDFPGCGSSPGSGESVDASSAGMPSSAGAAASASKFPSFQGKDLDGNEVTSDKLFSSNKVTVVNFWFTTCKASWAIWKRSTRNSPARAARSWASTPSRSTATRPQFPRRRTSSRRRTSRTKTSGSRRAAKPASSPPSCSRIRPPTSSTRTATSWATRSSARSRPPSSRKRSASSSIGRLRTARDKPASKRYGKALACE